MQIIQIPDGLDEPIPVSHGRPLESGKEYICSNAFAGLMLLSRWKITIGGEPYVLRAKLRSYTIDFDPFDPDEDWDHKHVWLMRGGGYGDLLMLTPLIREMKKRWPKVHIHVSCGDQYSSIFDGLGVDVEYMPIPYNRYTNIDCLIAFEDTVEGDPEATELHMAQLFASKAGITLTDIKPSYHVTPKEEEWAWTQYPSKGKLPRIGIQFFASGLYRSYPKMDAVMMALSKDAQVFLMGSPGQIELQKEVPNITNLMGHRLNFRQSASVVSTCDSCVSPDSALVHLCSALDVPCVGLYGPFPSRLRSSSSVAYMFDGVAPCAPCFFHAETSTQFPLGMPCAECKRCVALESIDPDMVAAKVLELALSTDTLPGSTQ